MIKIILIIIKITATMMHLTGVPWTLHSWIRTLLTAQLGGLTNILDELLQVEYDDVK